MVFRNVLTCLSLTVGLSVGLLANASSVDWNASERSLIQSLGPWPAQWQPDSSNRFSGDIQAVELGRQMFSDRRLSENNILACSDCHRADAYFGDGIALNRGKALLERHTPSLMNLSMQHWFGWDGGQDSLWAQSIRPIFAPTEMNASLADLRKTLNADLEFNCKFKKTTGLDFSQLEGNSLKANIGKLLAAYQETIVSQRTRFDSFRDSLSAGNIPEEGVYTEPEQRGLKLFLNEGQCSVCHGGANFSHGEFGDIGVSFFTESGVDKGRYTGIQRLKNSPFSLLGSFNDNVNKENAVRTKHLQLLHRNWGEFKVPSLRNIANTAPYMHNGSIENLRDVVDFYSELDEERLHSDGEKILRPLNLTTEQKNDLVAFLASLSSPLNSALPRPNLFAECLTSDN